MAKAYEGNMLVANDESWMTEAKCITYPRELFFSYEAEEIERAKEVCGKCAVQAVCLIYAVDNKIEHGVWGGTSEKERRRIIKQSKNVA